MLYPESRLGVIDNSGAKWCKIIRVYGGVPGVMGSLVLITVRRYRPGRKVEIGMMYKALIVRTKLYPFRLLGVNSCFDQNAIILFKKQKKFGSALVLLGTRIKSTISFEARKKGYLKIVSLAPNIL